MLQHCNSSARVLTSAGFDKFYIYILNIHILSLYIYIVIPGVTTLKGTQRDTQKHYI